MSTMAIKTFDPLGDSGAIFNYHRQMISLHGDRSSLALGWRDRRSQLVRFEILTGIADLNGKFVMDIGCGYADLLAHIPASAHYCGIEQIPELVDKAIAHYGNRPDVSFISGNFMSHALPIVDYVLASGSLNYASSDPAYIYKAITRLFDHCKAGLGFNLLSKVPENGLLVAYDQEDIINYCRTLSHKAVLKNDYDPDDFTIFIYR